MAFVQLIQKIIEIEHLLEGLYCQTRKRRSNKLHFGDHFWVVWSIFSRPNYNVNCKTTNIDHPDRSTTYHFFSFARIALIRFTLLSIFQSSELQKLKCYYLLNWVKLFSAALELSCLQSQDRSCGDLMDFSPFCTKSAHVPQSRCTNYMR